MDVLVIGGSVFLGRAVVGVAQALGAGVTVFNRGVSGPEPDGVEHVRGDRTVRTDVEQLAGRRFDVVVDTSGYEPADVTISAQVLAPTAGHYAFVSSVNVYPGWPARLPYEPGGVFDADPDVARGELPPGVAPEHAYGWRKVGCERAVERAFGAERCAILRGGVIVGPDDSKIGRLPWWVDRVARGGEVLVPGMPGDPVALIDARDLAAFALSAVPGVFQTAGPQRDTRAGLMAACAQATGSQPTLTYVDDDWLADQEVEGWTDIPLWGPYREAPATFRSDVSSAQAAGLRWRPLLETVRDTWAWQQSVAGGWRPTEATPGLAAAREAELLAAWRDRA